jgi:ADP-ribose pyrophosphatase YjhB (NUDIX family)
MRTDKGLIDFIQKGQKDFLGNLSIDCVIFGFHDGQLKVLLLRYNYSHEWALPGGFIHKKEDISEAANRILKERTGLSEIFLRQFHVFGSPQRTDHARATGKFIRGAGIPIAKNSWLLGRFITIGFYALVDFSAVSPAPDHFSDDCKWHDIHSLPRLMMDHNEIYKKALAALQLQLNSQPIGYNLLPEKFTMPELQKLYECLLDKKLDRRNFQRRILGYGILRRHKETKKGMGHKAPYLYSFDLLKYEQALEGGLTGGW